MRLTCDSYKSQPINNLEPSNEESNYRTLVVAETTSLLKFEKNIFAARWNHIKNLKNKVNSFF